MAVDAELIKVLTRGDTVEQHHQQHVRDTLGTPEQNPRVLRTTTGEFYDTALFKDR